MIVARIESDPLFTLSADLMCVAGFDGYFKRVNPAFSIVLGHSEPDLLAQPFISFVHPDDVASTNAEILALLGESHHASHSFQNRYRCADGHYRWLEWKAISAPDQLIYAVARDVTARKQFESQLKEYSKELERSNSELQQFAYVASHDLQEPLRAVAGCLQMLEERNPGRFDDRSRELMGFAVEGAKRMQTLINDLLAYSRAGSRGLSPAHIDARSAVDKAVNQLSAAVAESRAVLTIGPLPSLWADPVQLAQLFQNLIANAIKFRADKTPEIRVSAVSNPHESIFSVEDNGIGIAPEYHEKIFGLFQRLASRRDYSGTGIGLAICKKIVERHGGRIWTESQPGRGAAFRFTIPQRTLSI